MKIHAHLCQRQNIGDELNLWFWKELFGDDIAKVRDEELLVGIGTVLNNKLPKAKKLHIVGSGVGYGHVDGLDRSNWNIHFVRGKLSAKALGISSDKAISDPGILISKLRPQNVEKTIPISFMPHVGIDSQRYKNLIESMGWNYISPSDEEERVLHDIAASDKLITSAMHGAILADSYRTPWLPVSTSPEILPFKWQDWFSSLQLNSDLTSIPAYWPEIDKTIKAKTTNFIKTHQIKKQLYNLSESNLYMLSEDNILLNRQEMMLDKLEELKQILMTDNV